MRKSIIVAVGTLSVLAHGLRVTDLRITPAEQGLNTIPQGQLPIMTYTPPIHPSETGLKNVPQGHNGIMTYTTGGHSGWEWLHDAFTPDKEGQTILMRAHHRSGINLAKQVGACIAEHAEREQIGRVVIFPQRVDGTYTDESLAQIETPTLHFVRKLDEWIISWYQFAKTLYGDDFKAQDWMTKRGAMQDVHGGDTKLVDWLNSKGVAIKPEESIKSFLQRVPPAVGLGVAYFEMTSDVLPQALNFAKACRDNEKCQQVCVESFGEGPVKYAKKWHDLFMQMGVDLAKNDKLKTCIKEQREGEYIDGTKLIQGQMREMAEGHVKVDAKQMKEYLSILSDLDQELGMELKKANGVMECKGTSRLAWNVPK